MSQQSGRDNEAGVERVKLSGVRRIIADRMMESLSSSAQLTFHAEVDATRLFTLRAQWKREGSPISLEDCFISAFARCLARHRLLNGITDLEAVTFSDAVHIAVAIATPSGLMTPVIRDAAEKNLLSVAMTRKELIARALRNELKVSEMKGATATLSNLGNSRVQHFTPILNAGQLVLLGLGCVTPRLVMGPDGVEQRSMIGISLTVDHRIVDGAPAGEFLTSLCEEVEKFESPSVERQSLNSSPR